MDVSGTYKCRKLGNTPTKVREKELKVLDVRNPSFSNFRSSHHSSSFYWFVIFGF